MALSYQNLSVSNYFTIFLHYVFEVICVFITSVWLKYYINGVHCASCPTPSLLMSHQHLDIR